MVLNLLVVVHNLQVHRPGQAQRTRLTPYYAEDRTTLLGYVREEEDVLAAKTLEISAPASDTPHKALVSAALPQDGTASRDSIPDCVLKTWDGFPNGRFRVRFTREQFTATSKVALYWASHKLRGGRRGSTSAATPDKGRLSLHGCSGIIECNSGECTVQIGPGLDVSKEIKVGCTCGLALRHRPCTAEWSLVQYNEGAIFEHSVNSLDLPPGCPGHIESLSMEGGEAFRAMYMATKPKLLSHAKFWDRAAFVEECGECIISHQLNDGTYRPATYGRVEPPETRRPRIAVEISSDETSKRASRNRARSRAEDEGTDEDAPPAKRAAPSNRELRPRNQGVVVYAPVVPPAPPVDEAKITGQGRGWFTMEE
ncbi:hypothetical protein FB45DRAFT_858651 [Roridomyces roridus]|uniref:Uncharacterized protein n=1 Tax=Roridomyces roridus TaxID=1738132 RepID=A0AAD7CHQ4_9AGAR|nr:hypothetical protein FB45DRAFT_858651 [Roridomyces roridus]